MSKAETQHLSLAPLVEKAQALKAAGVDIVISYFGPHSRKDTIAKTEGLEMAPRKIDEYRGSSFEEMDTEAILARHPQVCVVDEFPHTSPLDRRRRSIFEYIARRRPRIDQKTSEICAPSAHRESNS